MATAPSIRPVLLALAAAAACGEPGDVPCRPGFVRAQDGHCYPPPPDPEPPSVTDAVLADEPPCTLLRPGIEIDWVAGCIEGACAGDRFDTVDSVLQRGADCALGTVWTCDWGKIEAQFPADEDDVLLPAPSATTSFIRAITAYDGATEEGLGIGVSVRCFFDRFGTPSLAQFVNPSGPMVFQQAIWEDFGLEVEDEEREDGEAFPDGIVDEITLTGAR